MKKTYQFNVKNKTPERQADSIKHEVNKYIARERRKELPDGVDYWDFDCRIGDDEKVATGVHHTKINENISQILAAGKESFYLEILAKPARRTK